MLRLALLSLSTLLLTSCATNRKFLTQDVSWKEYTSPPSMGAVTYPHCVASNRALHVFGGIREGAAAPANNQGFSFDLDRSRWQNWPTDNGPKALQNYATAWTDKGFFVFGGVAEKPSAEAFLFDTEAMTWRPLPGAEKVLQPRSLATATTVGKKVIVFGGRGKSENLNAAMLDLETLSFGQLLLPPKLQSRFSHVAQALGEKLFLWGGFQGGKRQNSGFLFDVVDQTWTPLPASPLSARANAKAVVVGSEIYVLGGVTDQGAARDAAIFDLATLSWRPMPWIPDPAFHDLQSFELVSVGRSGLMILGGKLADGVFNGQPWYYDFKAAIWQKVLALNPPPASIAHCVARNASGTIFVLGGIGSTESGLKQFDGLRFLPYGG